MNPSILLAALSVLGAAPIEEVPPYPYLPPPPPPWKVAMQKKLGDARLSHDFQRTPLREAMEEIAGAAGVSIRVSAGVEDTHINLTVKDMRIADVLAQVLLQSRLAYQLTENGVLIIERPTADDPSAELYRIGEIIESVRLRRFPTKEEKGMHEAAEAKQKEAASKAREKIEGIKKALRTAKLTRDFVETPFRDFMMAVAETCKEVNFMADPTIQTETRKVNSKAASRSVEKVLEEVLRSQELEHTFREGWYYIVPKGRGDGQSYSTFVTTEEQERGERKIFGQKLTRDLKGSRVCDLFAALAKDLGIEVYPDSRSWAVEVALPAKTAGMSLRQLASTLKRKGIEVVIWGSPFFDRPLPYSRDSSKPPKVPPGSPEVKWALYLITPKK